MKKIGKGFRAIVLGVIGSLILTAVINLLARNNVIPQDFVTAYGIISLVGSIITVGTMRSWGFSYTAGWFGGSWIFYALGFYSPLQIALNIVAPVAMTLFRLVWWVKRKVAQ